MLLGFQRRFESLVVSGSKTHSIRALRKGKRQIKPGDRLDCYGDARQKTMHLLGRFPCVRVEEIVIYQEGEVFIDTFHLSPDELEAFAWRDGFRPTRESVTASELMMRFWSKRLKQTGRWTGVIIHWNYEKGMVAAA